MLNSRAYKIFSLASCFFLFIILFSVQLRSVEAANGVHTGVKFTSGYGGEAFTANDNESRSDILYSYYTGGNNEVKIKDVYVYFDNYFAGTDNPYIHFDYGAGYGGSCSNSALYVKTKAELSAGGSVYNLKIKKKSSSDAFDSKYIKEIVGSAMSDRNLNVEIQASELANLYDSSGKLKSNPELIIRITAASRHAQGGTLPEGSYYRSTFNTPADQTQFALRNDALDAGKELEIHIPLNLPNPSIDLKADGSDGSYSDSYKCPVVFSWSATDVKNCDSSSANLATGGKLGSTSGTKSITLGNAGSVESYSLGCVAYLGSAIGDKMYLDTIGVTTGGAPAITSFKVNDNSAGTVEVNSGDSVSFSWTSSNAANCVLTASGLGMGSILVYTDNKNGNDTKTITNVTQNGTGSLICYNTKDHQCAATDAQTINISVKGVKTNGQCAVTSGFYTSEPTGTGACSAGTYDGSIPADTSDLWKWTCKGSGGGTDASCSASKSASQCGAAAGGTYSSAPTSNLCSSGTASSVTESGNSWFWQCSGGSQGSSCTASKGDLILTLEGSGGGTIRAQLGSTDSDLAITKTSSVGSVNSSNVVNCDSKTACKFSVNTTGAVTVTGITATQNSSSNFVKWGDGSLSCSGSGCSICNSTTQNGGCPNFTLSSSADIQATFESKGGGGGNDECGSSNNSCPKGAWSDLTDTSSEYKWMCGSLACSLSKGSSSIAVPSNFKATTGECDSSIVNLSWDSVSGASYYLILRNETDEIGTGGGIKSSPYADSGATSQGSSYSYKIKACDSGGNCNAYSSSVSADAPRSCDYNNKYTLTIYRDTQSTGTGVINVNSERDCYLRGSGSSCSYTYSGGSDIKLTADPDSGSSPNGWDGDCYSSDNFDCSVKMSGNKTVYMEFGKDNSPDPSVDLKSNPGTIGAGGTSVITGNATNVAECILATFDDPGVGSKSCPSIIFGDYCARWTNWGEYYWRQVSSSGFTYNAVLNSEGYYDYRMICNGIGSRANNDYYAYTSVTAVKNTTLSVVVSGTGKGEVRSEDNFISYGWRNNGEVPGECRYTGCKSYPGEYINIGTYACSPSIKGMKVYDGEGKGGTYGDICEAWPVYMESQDLKNITKYTFPSSLGYRCGGRVDEWECVEKAYDIQCKNTGGKCSHTYSYDSSRQVKLVAYPETGSNFKMWKRVNCAEGRNDIATCTVPMNSSKTAEAVFDSPSFDIGSLKNNILATIVEGLPADSSEASFTITASPSGARITLAASGQPAGSSVEFSVPSPFTLTGLEIIEIKLKAKNIPGTTRVGVYPISVTISSASGLTQTINVNLSVESVTTKWEEI